MSYKVVDGKLKVGPKHKGLVKKINVLLADFYKKSMTKEDVANFLLDLDELLEENGIFVNVTFETTDNALVLKYSDYDLHS